MKSNDCSMMPLDIDAAIEAYSNGNYSIADLRMISTWLDVFKGKKDVNPEIKVKLKEIYDRVCESIVEMTE